MPKKWFPVMKVKPTRVYCYRAKVVEIYGKPEKSSVGTE